MTAYDDLRLTAPRELLRERAATDDTGVTEFDVVRADDQVNLRIRVHGGTVDSITNRVTSLEPEEPIYFEILVGVQHRVESSIGPDEGVPTDPVASRLAGDSRVVVEVPDGLEFTLDRVLDVGAFALSTSSTPLLEPGVTETALEIPAGLIVSPTVGSRFDAPVEPSTHAEISERWRARLRPDPGDGSGRLVALFSHPGDPEFAVDVDEVTRDQLIEQTQVEPLTVRQLDLSPTGADLDITGSWATGQLASYEHRSVGGRDLRVEIVDRGFLAPFGHRAVVTSVTVRDIVPDDDGSPTAILRSDEQLTIVGTDVDGPHPYVAHEGRGLPFQTVAAADLGAGPVTRQQLVLDSGSEISDRRSFVVERGTEPVPITYVATDHDGVGGIEFTLPAVFVADRIAYQPRDRVGRRQTTLRRLTRWYQQRPDMATAALHGQAIAWAPPPDDSSRGDAGATQATQQICFRLDRPDLASFDPADVQADLEATSRPAFAARVERAVVLDRSGSSISGAEPPTLDVVVAPRFLEHGLGELNVDLGYLDIDVVGLDDPHVNLPATSGDGLLSLGFVVDTFSQLLGSGVEVGGDGMWRPGDALGLPGALEGFGAKLLGLIDLADLLPAIDLLDVSGSDGGTAANLPTIEVELIGADDPLSLPTGICTTVGWEPRLASYPAEADKPTFVVTGDFVDAGLGRPADAFGDRPTVARFEIETCVPGGVVVDVGLERFAVQLPPKVPVIALLVERVGFTDDNGNRSVDVDIGDWIFVGALGWLEPIKDLLFGAFGDGTPSFDDGISLDLELPLPSINLGVVGISNIKVGFELDAPTGSAARVEFGLSSIDRPFRVTVLGYGGTGHFLVVVDAADIVLIEGSIGITYELAVDVFIVSAAVSITLSAYVRYQRVDDEGEVEFGATVEVAGAVSILGLVKIAGSVMIGLSYRVNAKVLRGVAAVTGEISSLFGTSTVTRDVEIEVDFDDAGGAGAQRLLAASLSLAAPDAISFGDLFPEAQWTDYCLAFAEAA